MKKILMRTKKIQNEDVWEEIEQLIIKVRHIILEHLNTLPNADRREEFREVVGPIFVRFGGMLADLEESE